MKRGLKGLYDIEILASDGTVSMKRGLKVYEHEP
jgi:hypothetical protein